MSAHLIESILGLAKRHRRDDITALLRGGDR